MSAIRKVAKDGNFINPSVEELMDRGLDGGKKDQPQLHTLLSNWEFQVVKLLASGNGLKEKAKQISLSVKTIS